MRFLWPQSVEGTGAVGLFFLRLAVGVAFVIHGWPKIQSPFGWMDAMGPSHVPGVFQALAVVAEFGGGLALIVGLLTPIACFGLMCTMFVATWTMLKMGKPLLSGSGPSAELPLVYFFVSLLLLLIGPGVLSLDALIFGKKRQRFGRH